MEEFELPSVFHLKRHVLSVVSNGERQIARRPHPTADVFESCVRAESGVNFVLCDVDIVLYLNLFAIPGRNNPCSFQVLKFHCKILDLSKK